MTRRFASLAVLLTAFALPAVAQTAQPAQTPSAVQSADNIYVGDGLVYYSLRENKVISSDERDKTNWDVMINGVEIHPNRAGLLLEASFVSVLESPVEGMKRGLIKTAGGDNWYDYDMNSHFITPKENRTFVLQLPDDTYAKMEILSYYNRNTDEPRYITFQYVIQPDGSTTFPQ